MSSHRRLTGIAAVVTILQLVWSGRGEAAWNPDGNATGASAWWAADPCVAADGSGGAFVAWGLGVCAGIQHFERTGDHAAGWPTGGLPTRLCDGQAPVGDRHTRVVADGAGGAYVVSNAWPACVSCQRDPMFILVQRVEGDGRFAPGWPAGGVAAMSLDPWPGLVMLDPAEVPRVIPNGRDGVLIAWQAYSLSQFYWGGTVTGSIHVQSIGPDGARRWGDHGRLVCSTTGLRSSPEIVADGKGGTFVFWCEQRAPETTGRVFAQHVTASGAVSWAPDGIPVSEPYRLRFVETHRQALVVAPPFAVSDGAHGAFVSWAGARGADFDIHASRVTYEGALHWRADAHVCTAPGDQFDPRMVEADRGVRSRGRGFESRGREPRGGDVIIGWLDSRPGGTRVSAQRLDASGRLAWTVGGVRVGEAEVVAPYWAPRALLAMASDGAEGAFFVWPDDREGGGLFAARVGGGGGSVPGWREGGVVIDGRSEAFGSAAVADVGRGNAVVTWQNSEGASWATLLTPRGPAASSFSPRTDAPRSDDSSPAVWLKPGGVVGWLRLSLADDSPATLELFDVLGRRSWSREVGSLGGGEHDVSVTGGGNPAPGVYLARVTQGGRSATTRVALPR